MKKSYAGKISNNGAQQVKAPALIKKPGINKVRNGSDLRTGK